MPVNTSLRMECLGQAVNARQTESNTSQILTAAERFLAFVEGAAANAPVETVTEATPKAAKKPSGMLSGSEAKEIKLGGSKESRVAAEKPADLGSLTKEELEKGATIDEVRAVTLELRDKVNAAAVKAVLTSYGAATIQDLVPMQYGGYVRSCKAKLPAAEDDLGV